MVKKTIKYKLPWRHYLEERTTCTHKLRLIKAPAFGFAALWLFPDEVQESTGRRKRYDPIQHMSSYVVPLEDYPPVGEHDGLEQFKPYEPEPVRALLQAAAKEQVEEEQGWRDEECCEPPPLEP